MRYLSITEIIELHEHLLADTGGATGVRDLGALESAVSQPHASFGGQDLYPDLIKNDPSYFSRCRISGLLRPPSVV